MSEHGAIFEQPGDLNERITRTVRRLLDGLVRSLGDAGACADAGNQIVADELFALARRIDRHGLGVLIDRLDDSACDARGMVAVAGEPALATSDLYATDTALWAMVNVRSSSSGLSNNIFIGPWKLAHEAPHIRVQPDHHEQFELGNLAVVSVEDDPPQVVEGWLDAADLEQVRRYIALNRQAILDHWAEQTDAIELGRALQRLQ